MIYIYIFEDSQTAYSETPPTELDRQAVRDGMLSILCVETPPTFTIDGDAWEPPPYTPIKTCPATYKPYHSPPAAQ